MIIKENSFYQGLDLLEVYITDTDPTSADYLRIDSFPGQFNAGRNSFKLYGNLNKFVVGAPVLIEILDSSGTTVYTHIPDYYDSLKRRIVTVKVTENTAPGPAIVTICAVLKDELVPLRWRGIYNFKWQTVINITPFSPNDTDIIYLTPPEVELNTKVKPYISSSYRNNIEMITKEYGDYQFMDYTFEDHTGQADQSTDIFQKKKANSLVNAFLNPSITAFDRDNVFYLREQNFSAKEIVRNYPIINSGTGFYCTLGPNLVRNGNFKTADLEYWVTGSVPIYWYYSPPNGDHIEFLSTGGSIRQEIPDLKAGSYYLLLVKNERVYDPYTVSLGYDANNNVGSIIENTNATASYVLTPSFVDDAFILRCSDAGSNLTISAPLDRNRMANIRLYEIQGIAEPDFKMNSDMVGSYVQVYHPIISPATASGEVQYQTDPATKRPVTPPDPSYQSYVDYVLQTKDTAVDDRLYYYLIDAAQASNPEYRYIQKHKVDTFASTPVLDRQLVLDNFIENYNIESTNYISPTSYPIRKILYVDGYIYGTTTGGGTNSGGTIFKYDLVSKQYNVLYNFPSGSTPLSKLLPVNVLGRTYLFGTTVKGGYYNSGSIYRYLPASNTLNVVYSFGSSGSVSRIVPNTSGGVAPAGDLMQASDGYLYGTTQLSVATNPGRLYRFDPVTNVYTALVTLPGHYGRSGLTEVSGALWGVLPFGGDNGLGAVFKYHMASASITYSHSFAGTDGQQPDGKLVLAPDGNLYGITLTSSVAGEGCVLYNINPATDTFTDLYHLDAVTEGSQGSSDLFEDLGYLYGTCTKGATNNYGSAFSYLLQAPNTFTVLHEFEGYATGDGAQPRAGFLKINNSLYSTTEFGGYNNAGTIFRIDRTGINLAYVSQESGYMYHHNAVVPVRIPDTASFGLDWPRWTGPVRTGGDGIFAAVQLQFKNLDPETGDVSKVRISAKQKGSRGEYVDLGVYPTTPSDVLIDPSYVNHVHYIESPYRLIGFFKPTITSYFNSTAEDPAIKDQLFLNGWVTGSMTSSYFTELDFHKNLSFIGYVGANISDGSIARLKLTSSLAGNGMAYVIYTSSAIPPASSELNTWNEISYELLGAYPIFKNLLDTDSYEYYTGSSAIDVYGLNNLLVYPAIFKSMQPTASEDIYMVSPSIPYSSHQMTGSSASGSSGEHPFVFHNKLGYKTDLFLIDSETRTSQSLYMGLIFEYNSSSNALFGNTIDANNPHVLDVANVISREIGDREYIKNIYWDWYARAPKVLSELSCTASVSSDCDVLMDSVKLTAVDSIYSGSINENTVVFQTKNEYRFVKGTKYILSFNAISKIDSLTDYGDEIFSFPIDTFSHNATFWTFEPGYVALDISVGRNATLWPDPGGMPPSSDPGNYKFEIVTGQFSYSNITNPTTVTIEWPDGVVRETRELQPFTTHSFVIPITSSIVNDIIGVPKFIFNSTYDDINNAFLYITSMSMKYDRITDESTRLPKVSKLTAYGINSSLYGAPFKDQLVSNDIGEFIGELEHKLEYGQSGEIKNFGRIEMEFEAEVDGNGKIGFESTVGPEWYLSEISLKPKDRVGMTPNYSNIFIKVPGELVNLPLTFKIEYLNDYDVKAPYVTILNDVELSNIFGQATGDTGTPPTIVDSGDAGPVTIPPPATLVNTYNVDMQEAYALAEDGMPTSVELKYAPISSVSANIPEVTSTGYTINFTTAGNYLVSWSNILASGTVNRPITQGGSATGAIRMEHKNSSNTVITTLEQISGTDIPPTGASPTTFSDTFAGSQTLSVSAGDYIYITITASAIINYIGSTVESSTATAGIAAGGVITVSTIANTI